MPAVKAFFADLLKKLNAAVGRKSNNSNDSAFMLTKAKRQHPFMLAVLFTSLKLLIVAFVLICFAGLGLAFGIVKAYVDTAPTLDVAQLTISDRTSFLYDSSGDLITSIADVEYRDWVDIEDIPPMVQNAFIAVEDVRFYKHSGVDFKRLFSAALEILGNSNSSGGSTITQQLIKNKILGSQRNYKRKIQEAYLAVQLEKMISKEDILEAYLNDIYLGESNYGIKTAASDYFGKELSDLTIRECAMLAGLAQAPYTYNPRRNMYVRDKMEITNNRTNRVLSAMYQAGFISEEQYEQAIQEATQILKESKQKQLYDMPYFVEYAIYDVVSHLLAARELPDTAANRNAIENELRTGGYHIYTTVDRKIQNTVQETLSTWDKYPHLADSSKALSIETNSEGNVLETIQPQAAAVVLDYRTGELRAVVGGRDTPTVRKGINRAYQSYNEVGSSIKPLSVYGPALDLGLSPASIIANMDGPIEGWNTPSGYPSGGLDSRYGPVTLRRGVMSSLNVVAARVLMDSVTPAVAATYMEKLGANMSKINVDGSGLALGTSGLTPIQMAGAYGAIANEGVYLEPLSFTKVTDSEGNILLDAEKIRTRTPVFKKSTAYLLVDIMKDAVKSGTGTKAKIDGMTVAGKTGTNSDYASVYFAGITPYYVSTVFIGHDYPVNKLKSGASGGGYAAPLWRTYMEKIHEGLEDRSIIDEDPSALGLVKKTVCTVSGMLATDACKEDSDHKAVTDWFVSGTEPTEYCDMHVSVEICKESGGIATQFCPESTTSVETYILIRSGSQFDQFEDEYLFKAMPNAVRTDISTDEFVKQFSPCSVHAVGSTGVFELKQEAESMIDVVLEFMQNNHLSAETAYLLNYDIEQLRHTLSGYEYSEIESFLQTLMNDYTGAKGEVAIQQQNQPVETNEEGENGGDD